jgi:hypothetical protein
LVDYWRPGVKIRSGQIINVHPANLGWSLSVTTKPLPYAKTFLALADEILPHSFLTDEEPLRAWVPSSHPRWGVLHYVKGMARACTLLTPLDLIYDGGSAPHFAPLLASATVVSARVEVHADVVRVAIANASISARGSIKLAHDVITWAGKLVKLADQGVVAETVITMYNAQASQATAVRGARKTALTHLLRPEC